MSADSADYVKSGPWWLVHFDGDIMLSLAEVWPNGDAPEHPTAADVAAVMRRYTVRELLHDWCLADALRIRVDGEDVHERR